MKRGEIWTIAGGRDYASKPRPAVIVQDDRFLEKDSVSVCGLTTDLTQADIFRIAVDPAASNGLRHRSQIMADKVSTIPREKLGHRIGELSSSEIIRLNRAILIFLGLTSNSGPEET